MEIICPQVLQFLLWGSSGAHLGGNGSRDLSALKNTYSSTSVWQEGPEFPPGPIYPDSQEAE